MTSIKGEAKKDVISTYKKCYDFPLFWRKFFMNIENNREYIFNHCTRPLRKFDRYLREWSLNENAKDYEMRAFG